MRWIASIDSYDLTIGAAIAWLLAKSPRMLPIPGTASVVHLEEDVSAGSIRLTAAEMTALA